MLEAYGARLAVSAPDADALARIIDGLPPGWEPCPPEVSQDEVSWRFGVRRDAEGYLVEDGDGRQTACADLDLAVGLLRTQMRHHVGHHARDLVFVHAGVVAHGGRAIVIPGHSFSGKSTLVAALVREGATFYSDEYAMLDEQGLVRQYREPLSIRRERGVREEVDASRGDAAQQPVPVGVVAIAVYTPGATWRPRRVSAGAGVVAMMEHAVAARDRPAETLATLRRALDQAVILEGSRGEADDTARLLLDEVAKQHD